MNTKPTLPTYTENQLITLIKHRDQNAFGYLYDHYSGALLRVIMNVISDQEQANDILQKVFVNIWQKIDAYEVSRGRLFTWMLNIARNAAIDTLRSKHYRQQKLRQPITETQFLQADQPDHSRSDTIGLLKYVARLKPQQRTLIELVYFHGYSQPEIASMQSIPLSTIKTRVRSALSQLRLLLGHQN